MVVRYTLFIPRSIQFEAQGFPVAGELRLADGEVHVWQVEHRAELPVDVLTAEERSRAERFHFARDRNAFLTTRIVLRQLLARYTGLAPETLEFVAGERGKPGLATGGIEFNVSHSGSISVLAFACSAVGVDMEWIRPVMEMEAIVRRNFGPGERRQWAEITAGEREPAFFRGWTRKEAYVKALGGGLSVPLESFDVTITSEAGPRFLNVPGWSLYDLDVAGYAGALAVSSAMCAVRAWRVTGPIALTGAAG